MSLPPQQALLCPTTVSNMTFGPQSGQMPLSSDPALTPQQRSQLEQKEEDAKMASVAKVPLLFNDARDKIIREFNLLQAKWGFGKGFLVQGGPPITFTRENPYYKFKTVGYNRLPTSKPEDGMVCLLVNRKAQDVRDARRAFTEALHADVIKSSNVSVFIDALGEFGNDQTVVVIYAIQKGDDGSQRRLSSSELCAGLEQPACKAALTNFGVVNVAEKTAFNKADLDRYLSAPPNKIDPELWEQVKADNPDPKKYVPVPFIGFEDLNRRIQRHMELHAEQVDHLNALDRDVTELELRCGHARARVEAFRNKQQEIAHRLLQVMVIFEVHRKSGSALTKEEETMKVSFEEILRNLEKLNRESFNKLETKVRTAPRVNLPHGNLGEPMKGEIRTLMQGQTKGIHDLIKVIKEDERKLDQIERELLNMNIKEVDK